MRHYGFYIIAVFSVMLLLACGGRNKQTTSKPVQQKKLGGTSLYEYMVVGDDYTWYTGKARVRASSPYGRMSATLNLRMRRDSVIWATIDKLGFEIVRILVTPDSVFAVDRLNREYTQASLAGFLLDYGVNLTFGDLQNALMGSVLAMRPEHLESKREADMEMLTIRDLTGVTARYWITQSLPQRLIKSYLVDASGRSLQIENGQWETSQDGTQIPYGRVFSMEDTDGKTEIVMNFIEITKNVPASIPFSIPGNYARVR